MQLLPFNSYVLFVSLLANNCKSSIWCLCPCIHISRSHCASQVNTFFFFRSRHNSIVWIRTNWVLKDSVSPIWVEFHYGSKCFKINVTTCITKVSCTKTLSLHWIQVLSCMPYRSDSHYEKGLKLEKIGQHAQVWIWYTYSKKLMNKNLMWLSFFWQNSLDSFLFSL